MPPRLAQKQPRLSAERNDVTLAKVRNEWRPHTCFHGDLWAETCASSQLPLTPFHLFVCEWQICQVKCLYVVSHRQKPLGYTSGCKQSEQGRKSEDPEPELPCPANQDVLSGEFFFGSQPYNMLYNVSKLQAAKLPISLHGIMISEHLIRSFSAMPQFASSITHTLAHTCANWIVGSTCVPADQLVLLKMHALNIRHVHICVISTGARLERSRELQ